MNTKSFANLVLMGAGTIALSALLYYVYVSGRAPQGLLAASTWTLPPLALAGLTALFFGSLRLRSALKTVVAVSCLSLTALLYLAELVLAGSGIGASTKPFWSIDQASPKHQKQVVALAESFGATMDARNRIDLLTDFRKRNIDAVPALMLAEILGGDGMEISSESIDTDKLVPLGGVSGALTVLCNESGQYVTYTSDEHGLRNPAGIWNSPRVDMAAVGQSLIQGYCMPDGKGFVDLLRVQYPVTLNLGISGESSLLQLAAIKEYLPRYAPRVVLWFFSEGFDLHDLYNESTHPLLIRYLEPSFSQHLPARQPEIDTALRRFISDTETHVRETRASPRPSSFVERSSGILKLWDLREQLNTAYGLKSDDPQAASILAQTSPNLLSDTLTQARAVTSSWGGTLYFVYLPSWNRYRNSARVYERERISVLNIANNVGIPVIDIQAAFQAQNDPLSLFPFRRFGHYNEAGNRLVADTVLKFLSAHERRAATQ